MNLVAQQCKRAFYHDWYESQERRWCDQFCASGFVDGYAYAMSVFLSGQRNAAFQALRESDCYLTGICQCHDDSPIIYNVSAAAAAEAKISETE